MSTSIIGASVFVRATAPARIAKVIISVRRLGDDRRNREVRLASPDPAQGAVI
jgi:hypothetical protein